ncbi:MAG: AAA family ATPase [bacterium]|nr:AAA family ATPase [bacterium]
MRINRLDLTRFGPFTDTTFDLSAPGTHLIVGANEAGKTVSMAAIRQLLFGIPVRTAYDFVHEMRDLCLGAEIADERGELLEIVRVKKRSDTLRDPNGNTLDEGLLAKLLHDVNEEVYASLFTVGHEEIAAGGEALLDSDGEVGRALFSASRGTTDLTAVLRKLDNRAGELFKSAASKPRLNAAIREFKEVSTEARSISMSASSVMGLDKELATAQEDHDQVAARRRELSGRRTVLHRVRATRPLLANRLDYLSGKSELEAQGPLVGSDVRSRLEEAQNQRKEGESAQRATKSAIERLDEKLDELAIDTKLLEQQEIVEKLTRETGGYDQNEEDLPGLQARASTLERELGQLRTRLPEGGPLTDEGRSGLKVNQEQQIRQLAASRSELDNDLKHAVDEVEETKNSLETLSEELGGLDDLTDVVALVEVIARIRKAGDLEATRTDTIRNLEAIDRKVASQLAALGLSGVDTRAVDVIAVPTLEAIRRVRDEFETRAGTITRLEEQIEGLESQQDEADEELAQLLRSEEPLTTDDLSASRSNRDEGWRLIRGTWLGESNDVDGVSAWADGRPLQDAYEAAVEGADDVADRLRREASAVEQRASFELRLEALADDLEKRKEDLERECAAAGEADAAWAQLWEPFGITQQSPTDMEIWHDGYKASAQRSEECRTLEAEIVELEATITRHRSDLIASLTSAGEPPPEGLSLFGLLDHAEQIAADAAKEQQVHANATSACAEAETLLKKRAEIHERAEKATTGWQEEWSNAVTVLGLKATASTGEANSVLDALRDISEKGAAHEDLQRRIFGIKRRSAEFTDGVTAVLAALDGDDDLAEADPGAAVKMLSRRVKEAQDIATKSKAITEERENHEKIKEAADLRVDEAENLIKEMVQAAAAADESELSEAITRSEEHAGLLDQITQVEHDLREVAGKPLNQIEAEAAELVDVEIEPEVQQLDLELEVFDEQIKEKQTKVGELTNQRSLIDSSGEAADLMTQAQQSLASVLDYADDYVQTLLARRLLEEHVNAYRDEHQGPLLERASGLFRGLTLDRYIGLDTDTDDKGNPFLLARNADNKLLEISALSTGTRDQLYLALRLAALEQFMARRGPLPIILDDLFVHFDDERTKAGLGLLDQLADESQILLFTHHEQVARQASDVIDPARLTLHKLK